MLPTVTDVGTVGVAPAPSPALAIPGPKQTTESGMTTIAIKQRSAAANVTRLAASILILLGVKSATWVQS